MMIRTDIRRTATTTLLVIVVALAFSTSPSSGEETMSTVHPSNIVPPIDQDLPSQIETATFALG